MRAFQAGRVGCSSVGEALSASLLHGNGELERESREDLGHLVVQERFTSGSEPTECSSQRIVLDNSALMWKLLVADGCCSRQRVFRLKGIGVKPFRLRALEAM